MHSRIRRFLGVALISLVRWGILFALLFPIFWTVLSSFKSQKDLFAYPPKLFFVPSVSGYVDVLTLTPIGRNILDSVVVCSATVVIGMILGCAAAYALTRYRLKRSKDISFYILSTRMAPPIVIAVPFFLIARKIGIYDTHWALIIVYLSLNLGFIVWSMRSYFAQIPLELDEAAMVDGCSRLGALWHIIIPVALPGLFATAIMAFIFAWNEFLFAFLLAGGRVKTVPVALAGFITQEGMRWDEMTAAATIVLAPILFFAILVQRHFVKGVIEGAIKG